MSVPGINSGISRSRTAGMVPAPGASISDNQLVKQLDADARKLESQATGYLGDTNPREGQCTRLITDFSSEIERLERDLSGGIRVPAGLTQDYLQICINSALARIVIARAKLEGSRQAGAAQSQAPAARIIAPRVTAQPGGDASAAVPSSGLQPPQPITQIEPPPPLYVPGAPMAAPYYTPEAPAAPDIGTISGYYNLVVEQYPRLINDSLQRADKEVIKSRTMLNETKAYAKRDALNKISLEKFSLGKIFRWIWTKLFFDYNSNERVRAVAARIEELEEQLREICQAQTTVRNAEKIIRTECNIAFQKERLERTGEPSTDIVAAEDALSRAYAQAEAAHAAVQKAQQASSVAEQRPPPAPGTAASVPPGQAPPPAPPAPPASPMGDQVVPAYDFSAPGPVVSSDLQRQTRAAPVHEEPLAAPPALAEANQPAQDPPAPLKTSSMLANFGQPAHFVNKDAQSAAPAAAPLNTPPPATPSAPPSVTSSVHVGVLPPPTPVVPLNVLPLTHDASVLVVQQPADVPSDRATISPQVPKPPSFPIPGAQQPAAAPSAPPMVTSSVHAGYIISDPGVPTDARPLANDAPVLALQQPAAVPSAPPEAPPAPAEVPAPPATRPQSPSAPASVPAPPIAQPQEQALPQSDSPAEVPEQINANTGCTSVPVTADQITDCR